MTLGRNEICHCGSGKKYKKCCLLSDEMSLAAAQRKEEDMFEQWLQEDLKVGAKNLAEMEASRV
jgi:hypothetical protein